MKFQQAFTSLVLFSIGTFFYLTSCRIASPTKSLLQDTCNCCKGSLKKGLVAYYNFNGGSLNDFSGYNNHIVGVNDVVKTTDFAGIANNAYLFNGSSSYMKVKGSNSLKPDSITLVARVKVNGFYNGLCHATQILGKGWDDQSDGIYGIRLFEITNGDCYKPLDVNRQSPYAYADNNEETVVGAADSTYITTGQWKTYVFTASRTECKFYTDGELKNTIVKKSNVAFHATNDDLYIGRMENPQYPYWFNGIIDEIRIYNRPLCSEEVKLLQATRN
jgi:hypothetical protein